MNGIYIRMFGLNVKWDYLQFSRGTFCRHHVFHSQRPPPINIKNENLYNLVETFPIYILFSMTKDLYSRKDLNLARFNIDCM